MKGSSAAAQRPQVYDQRFSYASSNPSCFVQSAPPRHDIPFFPCDMTHLQTLRCRLPCEEAVRSFSFFFFVDHLCAVRSQYSSILQQSYPRAATDPTLVRNLHFGGYAKNIVGVVGILWNRILFVYQTIFRRASGRPRDAKERLLPERQSSAEGSVTTDPHRDSVLRCYQVRRKQWTRTGSWTLWCCSEVVVLRHDWSKEQDHHPAYDLRYRLQT